MIRIFAATFAAAVFFQTASSSADETAKQTRIKADVLEYIAAITKSADENQHSCIADKWESDADLNADSGISEADLAALLNPPQS